MRQSPTGPITSLVLALPFDVGAVTAKEWDSAEFAIALSPIRDLVIACPRAALEAGFMASCINEVPAENNPTVALANMTVGALNPASATWDLVVLVQFQAPTQAGYIRAASSGLLAGSLQSATIDHGNITTLTTLEATTTILASPTSHAPVVGDPVIVSPRNALPAGLGLSHARVSAAGVVSIGVANPTAGDINPAAILWDIFVFDQSRPFRAARSGRRGGVFRGNFNAGSVAALTTLETPITAIGAQIGDVATVSVFEDLDAGLAVSHARVSATNTVQIGLTNITAAPIDPAELSCIVQTIPRVPPL